MRCIFAIEPNKSLLFHRYVKIIDIFISRLLLEGAGATLSFTILGSLFTYLGWMSLPEDVLQVIGGWLMVAWFGMALGIMLGALAQSSELVDRLWHPIAYLVFPLSGAGFMVDALPTQFQNAVLYLPMVHGVEYLREGYFGSKVNAHYDMGYMATINLLLTFWALLQTKHASRKVIPE